MCGIVGVVSCSQTPVPLLERRLEVMGQLIAHRGPDGAGHWISPDRRVGLGHRRLSIIDLSENAAQPMVGHDGSVITYNGEIYNYLELRQALAGHWSFRSNSDTETILAAYQRDGSACLDRLRGMFAFALWDGRRLFCACDNFGIKPFYYAQVGDLFYFASEIKALIPFLATVETDPEALADYVTFQYTLGAQTLFKGVSKLMPGHALTVESGTVRTWRVWDVRYDIDFDHSPRYFTRHLRTLLEDSIDVHLRSDVPVGAYLSGGLDSSLITLLANRDRPRCAIGFHGKFTGHSGYDESSHAEGVAGKAGIDLHQIDITAADFRDNIEKVIYHLDVPVAGPGSFPQYMVSGLAAKHVKVVLGGQGGDEIFGGYARYLIAYFEQCIKAAIDGSYRNGNFVVTAESIIPNLIVLQEYKPLIAEFWKKGLFGPLDERYFRLIDRSNDMENEIDWALIDRPAVFERFQDIFNNERNVGKKAYFDSMTHFDFKCLLPALLHVEDRMSMAHGLESRVPLLDRSLVEFVATVPADIKFKNGHMKRLVRDTFSSDLPASLLNRRDKMGFPVPLKEWFSGELQDLVRDIFQTGRARRDSFINTDGVMANFERAGRFSRKTWGLLSLELWHQVFHDRAADYRRMMAGPGRSPDRGQGFAPLTEKALDPHRPKRG
jgi:asparagine synthase (glutamine-hydrolysing)